mmetsp:Transcript_27818/g.86203  ORF Transcript_27818/g.86203 Transcript_27818/m.86203 type:complete len:237 (-) Transcript_27818:470-1180(-)
MLSGKLVAAMTTTALAELRPSSSASSWLIVRFSSLEMEPLPAPFCPERAPMASISSMNTMHGDAARASSKSSRTRFGPEPPKISMKSAPLHVRNGRFASPATALAMSVLPVPGWPVSRQPFGRRPPRRVNFFGSARKSTYCLRSSLASGTPMTSSNLVPLASTRYCFGFRGFIMSMKLAAPAFAPPLPSFSGFICCWKRRRIHHRGPRKSTMLTASGPSHDMAVPKALVVGRLAPS